MDTLLRKPEEQDAASQLQRVVVDYAPRHQRFAVKQKSFTQQYSHIYTKRLYQLRPILQYVLVVVVIIVVAVLLVAVCEG